MWHLLITQRHAFGKQPNLMQRQHVALLSVQDNVWILSPLKPRLNELLKHLIFVIDSLNNELKPLV